MSKMYPCKRQACLGETETKDTYCGPECVKDDKIDALTRELRTKTGGRARYTHELACPAFSRPDYCDAEPTIPCLGANKMGCDGCPNPIPAGWHWEGGKLVEDAEAETEDPRTEIVTLLQRVIGLLSDMSLCDSAPNEHGVLQSTENALHYAKSMGWDRPETRKPLIVERFADNGAHSHWAVIDPQTGLAIWEGEGNDG